MKRKEEGSNRSTRWAVTFPTKIEIIATVRAGSRDEALDAAIKRARKGRGSLRVVTCFMPRVEGPFNCKER